MDDFSTLVKEVTSIIINNRSPVEIFEYESELFNSLPANEVVPALLEVMNTTTDLSIESRAFDALLKIQDFDKVGFLIGLFNKSDVDWRIACGRNLSRFQDSRAVAKLCDVLLHDSDADIRYVAAESLAKIGDHTAIEALIYAIANDTGKDYEGFRVSDMANQALQQIRERDSHRQAEV
jgi:HEAT repeat protein